MSAALIIFLGSVVLFTAFSFLVEIERVKGSRVFLPSVRSGFDNMLAFVYQKISDAWSHFIHYIVRLGWYYSVHSFLRTLLRIVVASYDYLEHRFERNRIRTKLLRDQKQGNGNGGHFEAVAAHKAEVALSPQEEEELKHRKLHED